MILRHHTKRLHLRLHFADEFYEFPGDFQNLKLQVNLLYPP